MSERTHSPEGTPQGQSVGEFTTNAQTTAELSESAPAKTGGKNRFSRRKKLALLAGGTLAITGLAVGLFQVLKQDPASAQTGNAAQQQAMTNMATRRPLARVGKQVIPWEVVAEECMLRHGDEILQNIINRTIIYQACQERGIQVTNEEVDQEISRIAQKFNLTPDNWYQMLQAERNLTPMQYRRDVIWPMLALKKIAGNKVDVTEADLQKAFESAYGERVMAKMIMFDNFRRAQDVWTKARKNPETFEKLAQEHSIEPNSKAMGGTIPPIRRHGGNKELEDKAFAMKPGEISPVVQVGFSRYVIIKCEGRTEPHVKAMTPEIHKELYAALVEEKTQEAVAKVFKELKESARIDNYLKGTANVGKVEQTSHQTPGAANTPSYPQRPAPPRTATQTPGSRQQPARN